MVANGLRSIDAEMRPVDLSSCRLLPIIRRP
jgi:hypothetical protein